MSTIIDDYREAMRAIYGDKIADNINVEVKDGWYHVSYKESVNDSELALQPTRYRKTQLQNTIANLRARAQSSAE